jgi:hypothetical protein
MPLWTGIVTARPSGWFHRSWLPVCLVFLKPSRILALRNARAVALGMHDFNGVGGQLHLLLTVFCSNHREHIR